MTGTEDILINQYMGRYGLIARIWHDNVQVCRARLIWDRRDPGGVFDMIYHDTNLEGTFNLGLLLFLVLLGAF